MLCDEHSIRVGDTIRWFVRVPSVGNVLGACDKKDSARGGGKRHALISESTKEYVCHKRSMYLKIARYSLSANLCESNNTFLSIVLVKVHTSISLTS